MSSTMSAINASPFRDWIAPNEVYSSATFSANPHPKAIKWLKANKSMINWSHLSMNTNPEAIEMLNSNIEEIDWAALSRNPSDAAIEILKANQSMINWTQLAVNPNEKMLELINIGTYWNTILANSNKKIREVALYVAWNCANTKPDNCLNVYAHSLINGTNIRPLFDTLSCDQKSNKISFNPKVMDIFTTDKLIPLYKDEPLLVDHVEANLNSFRDNGSIQWNMLVELWSNPGIFKTNMDTIAVLPKTEIELMQDELNELRVLLDTSRDQFKDIEGRLFKQEVRYRKSLTLLKSQEEDNSNVVSSLREQIESQQAEISMLSSQTKEQDKEIAMLKSQVCDQAEELEELQTDLAEYEGANAELTEQVAKQEAKIEDLKYINNESTIELEILRTEKERQAAEIATLRNTLVFQQQKHEDAIEQMHRKLFEQEHDNENIQLFGCW